MFQGTIPGPMRAVVRGTAGSWPRGPVYVPCCGNFTIERSLAGMGFALHSSAVSIYTTAIGRWLTGQPVGVRFRDESTEQLHWLANSLDDGTRHRRHHDAGHAVPRERGPRGGMTTTTPGRNPVDWVRSPRARGSSPHGLTPPRHPTVVPARAGIVRCHAVPGLRIRLPSGTRRLRPGVGSSG
jgi:hypothetical protein